MDGRCTFPIGERPQQSASELSRVINSKLSSQLFLQCDLVISSHFLRRVVAITALFLLCERSSTSAHLPRREQVYLFQLEHKMQYRLFGNLELPPPEEFLSSQRLKRLNHIKAALVQFEATEPQTFISDGKQALHEVISDFVEPTEGKVAPSSPPSHQLAYEFLEPEPMFS